MGPQSVPALCEQSLAAGARFRLRSVRRRTFARPCRPPACATYTFAALASGESTPALRSGGVNEHSLALAREWRRLGRAATAVAVLTSPIVFAALISGFGWPWYWALLAAVAMVVVFR